MLEANSPPDPSNEPLLAVSGCDDFESETGQQALKYAKRGWRVLRLEEVSSSGECSCGDRECANPGKHPMAPHGVGDATTDEDQIRQWWDWPEANVGVATGNGLIVLSAESDEGKSTFLRLTEELADIPRTRVVDTGREFHFYFRAPAELLAQTNKVKLGAGLYAYGTGGYVVAPPSQYPRGHVFKFLSESDPAALPTACCELIEQASISSTALVTTNAPVSSYSPVRLFSGAPFRHVLSAAFGPRPHPKKPADPHECCKVQEADTSISFGGHALPIIGIDTEYVQDREAGDRRNRILSYQFAVIAPKGAWRGIVYCEDNKRLTLSGLIGHVLGLGLHNGYMKKWPVHVFVASHHTNAVLTSFADF